MLLETRDLDVAYGRIRALAGASIALAEGEIVGVLGANGAGKSSLLSALLGVVRPRGGRILFDGADVTGWPAARRVRGGLVLVPEGRRILVSLSVHDNLLMGAYCRRDMAAVAREADRIYARFPNL
ncbi:MAG: ATP-binding cassette domain-containing protein, partial [Candidatus Eiseniibacteriota bacterium]